MIFLHDAAVKGIWRTCAQLPAKISALLPDEKLYRNIGRIAKAVINVLIEDTGAGSKGNPPSAIREKCIGMVVQLGHGKGAVQHHPMDQIGKLAKASACLRAQYAMVADGKTRQIPLLSTCFSHRVPQRKGLSGKNDQTVYLFSRHFQV